RRLSPREHYELAKSLAELRDEGVLVMGSGNVTHNLRDAVYRMRSGDAETPHWAARFDETVAKALEQHDTEKLVTLWETSPDGRLAHPTPDHWLPLLYVLGASERGD